MNSHIICVGFFILLSISQIAQTQYVSETVDDKTYFDAIENEIEGEVAETKENLIDQAKVVEGATRNFAASQVTHNFFKALRHLAERELESISIQDRLRQPRQEDGEDDDGESATTKRTVPLIPVLANILKQAIGGENSTLNLTRLNQAASKFFLRPIGSPFAGLTNLLGLSQPQPTPDAKARSPLEDNQPLNPSENVEPEFYYLAKLMLENSRLESALLVNANNSIPQNGTMENSNLTLSSEVLRNKENKNSSDSSASTLNNPENSSGPGIIYIDILAKDIQAGLDGLLKAMPDIFKGAREAIALLQSIQEIYDS